MSDVPQQKLCGIIMMFGRSISTDARRCEEILKNLCGGHNRAVDLLSAAVKAQITKALLEMSPGPTAKAGMEPLIARLQEEQEHSTEEARWVVESWALALDLISESECTVTLPEKSGSSRKSSEVSSPSQSRAGDLFVGGVGGGCLETINTALARASPGARIFVRPGRYLESIVIQKNVEIIGDGPQEQILIESIDSPCITMQTDRAAVRGLTLRAKEQHCIQIPRGELLIEDCDISIGWMGCAAVQGSDANPTFRRCKIHHGQHRGILFTDHARGTLEDCEIFANVHPGIVIEQEANPTIRRCVVYDGNTNGILITDRGQGIIEDCDIRSNSQAGIEITQGGQPAIRRCKIHDGIRRGVLASDRARGTLEECEIFANAWAGVSIERDSNLSLESCHIHRGQEAGVIIYNASGTLEGCEVSSNNHSGLVIAGGGSALVRRSRFYDGIQAGVWVTEGGQGILQQCEIRGNAGAGIEIGPGSSPVLQQCQIRNGLDLGVLLRGDAAAILDNCDILGNAGGGIKAESGAQPLIKGGSVQGTVMVKG